MAKGHVLTPEDIQLLESEGLDHVWVTILEEGEIPEEEVVLTVGKRVGSGFVDVQVAPGGRSNLVATADCCVLVDEDLLRQLNCSGGVVIGTVPNFSFARRGQRIATVKSLPFAVRAEVLDAILGILDERGPLLQARAIQNPVVAVLYSDPVLADRARQLFEHVVRQRLEKFGVVANYVLSCLEQENAVARALLHLVRAKPTVILIASTTAPAGPDDEIGRAIQKIGGQIERYLAPVEPGNLLLLAYKDGIPIVSAPGCFRSAKPNVVDLILPPLLARYRISSWEIGGLGHGGLLA